ncbi:MAG TPA: TatD family hydrolase [Anaerolineae bacterium]|jgi:TatD DNase family protein
MLFDTHCHLDVEEFISDWQDVYQRAHHAGVTRFINPAYDVDSSKRAVSLAQQQSDIYSAAGIHPNNIIGFNQDMLDVIRRLAKSDRVVAIGEIGLDYHWNTRPKAEQIDAFTTQLALADEFELPAIIHCRDAYDDILDILERHQPKLKVVLHAFGGSSSQAEQALKMGCYLGIGGPVTFKNASALRTIVAEMPANRILIETDAPYLAPHPHRGKRNEPAYLALTAARIAEVRNMDLEQLAHLTYENACSFFGLTLQTRSNPSNEGHRYGSQGHNNADE